MIAALSFFENWLPPLPADAAIALGAFVTHGGSVTPFGVFLATWVPNVVGAMAVWAVSRRFGRQFFASSMGHRLFSEKALHFVETEYGRFGGLGLFVVKLLPGARAIAAPFAGMANVSFFGALLPMAAASAIWYGVLIYLGSWIGREWHWVEEWLVEARWPLGVVGALVLGLLVSIVLRRRHAARHAAPPADD